METLYMILGILGAIVLLGYVIFRLRMLGDCIFNADKSEKWMLFILMLFLPFADIVYYAIRVYPRGKSPKWKP